MKKKDTFLKDSENEGKDRVYLDYDRMTNEGLAGGNVYQANSQQNIEEAVDFHDEEPPANN